ncbi:MAG: DNA adenine methylase [Opitutales bacterium]|nr:DNA adenine methylase [Opitutales bacterium]
MNPVFPYSGGKRRMLKYILPIIPEHETYIEPFAGGLAVFLANPRVKNEIINDLNHEVGNFYLYVREHHESLLREMEDYLHSADIFEAFKKNKGLTELQRVARWFLLKVSSFSGFGDCLARDSRGYRGFNRERHEPLIEELHERLRNVTIDSRDWQKVVNLYDNEKAFIYFDPPYCTGDSGIYDAWTPEDMQILRNSLYSLKGSWLLSCDGSDICREIFADFAKIEVPFKYSSGTQYVGRPVKSEMLVACDSLADAMQANFNAVQSGKRWRAAA